MNETKMFLALLSRKHQINGTQFFKVPLYSHLLAPLHTIITKQTKKWKHKKNQNRPNNTQLLKFLFIILSINFKGGKIYGHNIDQDKVKASIWNASGSKLQETNFLICLFIQEAKRSMSGLRNCLQILTKMSCFNIHSLESANFLKSKSA